VPYALPRTRCALTAPFHPYLIHRREPAAIGGSFSVALFLASRRTAVSRHPTLWSPDFPLVTRNAATSDRLADSRFNLNMHHPTAPAPLSIFNVRALNL
jgi:hypothetical protein